jgi:hypothetical protein
MRKPLWVVVAALTLSACGMAERDDEGPKSRDYLTFTDAAFEHYCIEEFDTNHDGRLSRYEAEGVRYRLAICHIPFSFTPPSPFDIEIDTYTEWGRLLKEEIGVHLMLSGHHHKCYLSEVGSERDHKGQPCPVVVASRFEEDLFVGGAITLDGETCHIAFTDNYGKVHEQYRITL